MTRILLSACAALLISAASAAAGPRSAPLLPSPPKVCQAASPSTNEPTYEETMTWLDDKLMHYSSVMEQLGRTLETPHGKQKVYPAIGKLTSVTHSGTSLSITVNAPYSYYDGHNEVNDKIDVTYTIPLEKVRIGADVGSGGAIFEVSADGGEDNIKINEANDSYMEISIHNGAMAARVKTAFLHAVELAHGQAHGSKEPF